MKYLSIVRQIKANCYKNRSLPDRSIKFGTNVVQYVLFHIDPALVKWHACTSLVAAKNSNISEISLGKLFIKLLCLACLIAPNLEILDWRLMQCKDLNIHITSLIFDSSSFLFIQKNWSFLLILKSFYTIACSDFVISAPCNTPDTLSFSIS